MKRKVILDCDPGLDDALALVLAHGDPTIDVVAITTVSGNVGLDTTTGNALALREYLRLDPVPVAAGADRPLVRPPGSAAHLHGESGLGDVPLPQPRLAVSTVGAVDLIIRTIRENAGEIHVVATGPLTNVALALRKDPAIAGLAASFTMMGGSAGGGNVTPAAEFNVHFDPEAAREVFDAGWEVGMVGLDVTRLAKADSAVLDRFRGLGTLAADLLVPLATFLAARKEAERDGQVLHDICAVARVARPDLFTSRPARVRVETVDARTAGMTAVDFRSASPNAAVATDLDVEGFWDHVVRCYARVADAMP
ncbi:MAG TPA: nucleoside hydrolase [Umezawaea sp.]|nr:nucleoside hydrolase [Umezawaea sp.]